ncbi:hypothetical protein BG28_02900 [Nesterenkonia sp. AN1]|uniref:Uncharacterized protein n=1 Tax=Nesterenkonia aurantiaca TaxID=1436010 RepID=A0A4R7G0Y2_9MICC|nr:hypothetical protein BG28_02900 [Nesterenkonia sp. AN1]TDS84777.1 hypothetical protein EV640_107175 [Nesterenkonia aurantiaca]
MVDVFVHTVVLGLFVQSLPEAISESSAMTLLTGVVLGLTALILRGEVQLGGTRGLLDPRPASVSPD